MRPHTLVSRLSKLCGKGWKWTHEGKLEFDHSRAGQKPNTPWIYHNSEFDCFPWFDIFWGLVTEKKAVHSRCQGCWKVVLVPRTLEELVKVNAWQETLSVPCKCGIEKRSYTPRLYGAYFYNYSVEQGRERYAEVRAWADENLGPDAEVLLKRGCTEMEMTCGPSDTYAVSEDQAELEAQLNDILVYNPLLVSQPDIIKQTIYWDWVVFAYEHGDETYKTFTDGKPPLAVPPAPVMYHLEVDNEASK